MNIDIKKIVKSFVSVNQENNFVEVNLKKVNDGEWKLSKKFEYKNDVYEIPDSELFFEVCLVRFGTYHSGYTYDKPKFNLVTKSTKKVVSYPAIASLSDQSLELKEKYFDKNDDTKLIPIYTSGWVYHDKVNSYESVYNIDGVLFKQTLYGNSDWTEIIEYSIVEKVEETVVSYKKES